MWIRHFRAKKRTARWKAFRDRYYKYHPEDCVDLCKAHHREIHSIYWEIIGAHARRLGPCRDWTWVQAERLMAVLRTTCAQWLLVEGVSS